MKHLKKHPYLLWAALLAALLMTSCDNDDNADSLPGEMIEVRVATPQITESGESTEITKSGAEAPKAQTVTVPAGNGMVLEATLKPDSVPATRGTTTLATGVKYRIIAFNKQNYVSPEGYICHADYEIGTAEPIAGKLQVPAGKTYTFVCYSLGNTDILPDFNKDDLYRDADIDTSDLLLGRADYTITSPYNKIEMRLRHMETQITLEVISSSIKKEITDISGTIERFQKGHWSLNGSMSPYTKVNEIAIPWDTTTLGSMKVKSKAMYILGDSYGPLSLKYNLHSITVGGVTTLNLKGEYGAYNKYSLQLVSHILPGKNYIVTLMLREAPPSSDDGISVGGSIWARGNLIFEYSTFRYKFASSQEYVSKTNSLDDNWAWHSPFTTSPYYSTYNGIKKYIDMGDICRNINPIGSWRMPTMEEFTRLIYTEKIRTSKNGVGGIYFGTATEPEPGTEENYLFLPYAGLSYVNGNPVVTTGSFYWTNNYQSPSEGLIPSYPNEVSVFRLDYVEMRFLNPEKYRAAIRCVKRIQP